MGKIFEHFIRGDTQMANKYMKRYSTSLVIREMRFEITVRYLYTSTTVATINKTDNSKCWSGCGKTEIFIPC